MSKYISEITGKEIKVGDTISIGLLSDFDSERIEKTEVTLTEEILDSLVKLGMVKKIEDKDYLYKEAINRIAKYNDISASEAIVLLNAVKKVNKWAALLMILKEISTILSNKYLAPLKEWKYVYIINPLNGTIITVTTSNIPHVNYNTIPVFRTKNDAEKAKLVVEKQFKDCFNE